MRNLHKKISMLVAIKYWKMLFITKQPIYNEL